VADDHCGVAEDIGLRHPARDVDVRRQGTEVELMADGEEDADRQI
jgi:hypothetical protein